MGVKAASIKPTGNNTCHDNAGCSHFCFYKPSGDTKCGCPNGYELDINKKSCKPLEANLIYATSTSINTISLEKSNTSGVLRVTGKDLSFIAVHLKSGTIIWIDKSVQSSINGASLNHSSNPVIFKTGYYDFVRGLALDQVSGNVYWSQHNKVEVSRLNGYFRKTIISTDRPCCTNTNKLCCVHTTLLALNIIIRKLYWIEETFDLSQHSALYESNLDGSQRRFLTNITKEVSGLAVDVNDSSLYWIEKYSHKILRLNIKDMLVTVIAYSFDPVIGLAIYLDRLYFCESDSETSGKISSVRKINGDGKLKFSIHGKCQDLTLLQSSTPTGGNLCEFNNGGCEQLCFALSQTERICECETHFTISSDHTSCIGPQTFILISEETLIYRVVFSKMTEVPIHFNFPTYISSFEYSVNSQTLYWLDEIKHQIFFSENGVQKKVNLQVENAFPISFVIDLFTNFLYWIDGKKNTISYIELNNSLNYGTVFNKKGFGPLNLAILPEKGLLFFISQQLKSEHYLLLSIRYDGSNLLELQKIGHISDGSPRYDIAVDHKENRIYWLDKNKAIIQSVNIKGQALRTQFTFNSQKFAPVAISVFDKYLYWLDQDTNNHDTKLKRVLLDTEVSKGITELERNYKKVNDLLIVDVLRWKEKNPCALRNGGCSHICFPAIRKNGEHYAECLCPLNFTLVNNKIKTEKNCKPQNEINCPFMCNNLCVTSILQCIYMECFEDDCLCSSGEFKCLGSACINAGKVCDGTIDCVQGDDEETTMCGHFNNFTTPTQQTLKPLRVKVYSTGFSKSLAGIVSGAILTTLMFIFGFYFCCKMSNRKLERLKKEQEIYKLSTFTEQIIILPDSKVNNSSISLYRYISGSSGNVSDNINSTNFSPPSTVSTMMSSVSQRIPNIERYFPDELELPAPPATPLYMPSDIDSIMTSSNVDVSSCTNNQCSCNNESLYISKYKSKNFFEEKNSSRIAPSMSSSFVNNNGNAPSFASSYNAAPSLASSYKSRHLSVNGFHNSKVYYPRTKYSNFRRDPPQWVNNSNMHRIADMISIGPLPSLASDSESLQNVSSVSPSNSVLEEIDSYLSYAPPPSPGTEYIMSSPHSVDFFPSDNVFNDEPCERDFLMHSDNENSKLPKIGPL